MTEKFDTFEFSDILVSLKPSNVYIESIFDKLSIEKHNQLNQAYSYYVFNVHIRLTIDKAMSFKDLRQ